MSAAAAATTASSTAQQQASAFRVTLLQLQNKTRRDPEGYREEYKSQLEHFNAQCRTIGSSVTGAGGGSSAAVAGASGQGAAGGATNANNSNSANKLKNLLDEQFIDVANFITHCSHCFPELVGGLADQFIRLLNVTKGNITSFARMGIVKNLILLRSKALVSPEKTLPVFFELLLIRDKELRHLIIHHIISDVKKMNINATSAGDKKKNQAARTGLVNGNLDTSTKGGASVANKRVQAHLFSVVEQDDAVQSRCALLILMDLYHRNIWADDRTVECIAKGCFSKHTRIVQACLRFFLMQLPKMFSSGGAGGSDSDEDVVDPGRAISKLKQKLKVKKKTAYRERVLDRQVKAQKRKYDISAREEEKRLRLAIDPLRFVRDPQTFSERLFAKLQRTTERFEIRILFLNVLARVVAEHEIVLVGLYPFLERYMEPTQIRASQMMALAACCVHKLSPPEPVLSLVKVIANHFVNDRSDQDSITIGINTIREITKRQPLAMTEELLGDLVEYKQQRGDRGVIMAARALLQFYREVQPSMLPKKWRGDKDGAAENKDRLTYGASNPFKDIPGMELLIMDKGEGEDQDLAGMTNQDQAEIDSLMMAMSSDDDLESEPSNSDDGSESSGDWCDVSSGSEGMIDFDDDGVPKLVNVDRSKAAAISKKKAADVKAPAKSPSTLKSRQAPAVTVSPSLKPKKSSAENTPSSLRATKKSNTTTSTVSLPKAATANVTAKMKKKEEEQENQEGFDSDMWIDSDEDESDEDEIAPQKKKGVEPTKRQKRGRDVEEEEDQDDAEDDSAYDGDDEEFEEEEELGEFEEDDEEEEDEEGEWEEGEWEAAASDNEKNGVEVEGDEAPPKSSSSDEDEEWAEDVEGVQPLTKDALAKARAAARRGASDTGSVSSSAMVSGASKFSSSTHLLTDDDFARLQELKDKALLNPRWAKKAKKDKSILAREKKRQLLLHDVSASSLTPETIETFTKKKIKADREAKIEKTIEMRKASKSFEISKKRKSKLNATNTEKNKQGKLFQMTKRSHRVGAKMKRSIIERGDRKKDMKKKDIKFRIKRGWKT